MQAAHDPADINVTPDVGSDMSSQATNRFFVKASADIGKRFGQVTVIGVVGLVSGHIVHEFKCDCGKQFTTLITRFRSGKRLSCGCTRKSTATHGMFGTQVYDIWHTMKQRCTNPNAHGYEWYGGRGIRVCQRWMESFEAFYQDVGPRPGPEYSLDRKDSNGDYCKDNVRWATDIEQIRHRRNTTFVTAWDSTKPLAEWAAEYNLHIDTVRQRLNKGWSPEQALSTPLIPRSDRRWKRPTKGTV